MYLDSAVRCAACVMLLGLIAVFGFGCGGGGGSSADLAASTSTPGTGASTSGSGNLMLKATTVQASASSESAPFNSARLLNVPQGYGVKVLARVPGARFLLVTPNGDVLVSQPSTGNIVLLRTDDSGVTTSRVFASGMTQPHDMVITTIAGLTWLYVSESDRVTRARYTAGDTAIGARQIVVDGLPDSSTAELRGAYAHTLKNIAVSSDGSLYVSIASSCNACESDGQATPVRGSIYRYDADGGNGRLFARGIRNAEGLDFVPGTNRLWMAVNNRDDILYPLDQDLDGDGVSDLGKRIALYVDEQPPELFTEVRDGGDYGWPYCNAVANPTLTDFSFLPDYELNRDSSKLDCSAVTPISRGFHAHSAPLGFSFLQNSNLPAALRNGAAVALHGCWNCTQAFGYKVVLMRFDDQGAATTVTDLVTGFVTSDQTSSVWGRPVDVAAYPARSSLLISDDYAGAVYEMYPLP